MNRFYNGLSGRNVFVFLFVAFCGFSGVRQAQGQIQKGVVRVKVTEAYASDLQRQNENGRQAFGVLTTGSAKLNVVNSRFKATEMKRVFPYAGKFEGRHRKYGLHLWYEVQIDPTAATEAVHKAYRSVPEILVVEPVRKKRILHYDKRNFKVVSPPGGSSAAPVGSPSPIMNDPMLDQQWHYNNHGQTNGVTGADIDLLKAWTIETGKKNVVVAIIDGGIETSHPDLKNNIWINEDEIPGNGIDDDNNGFVDDINGFSFVDWRPAIAPQPHGTHVAGTVGAVNNNGIGVSGVAGGSGQGDGVRLMSCAVYKELLPNQDISAGQENAFVYAADNGAVIAQNSWDYNEFGKYDQIVLDAIDYFVAEAGQNENGIQTGPMKGGIVIFSAGNDDGDGLKYPAAYEPVFSVAAISHRNVKAGYSNYADWVDISAPGGETSTLQTEGVLSTSVNGGYAYLEGTSMAAPHVSGTAALIVSHFGGPGFTPDMLRQRMLSTISGLDDGNPMYAGKLGRGRINAFHALYEDNDFTGPESITDLQVKKVVGTSITLEWTAPYDKGAHSASYYEMRYSTSPITAENFSSADYVPNQIKTGPTGIAEELTIKDLQPETNYYVAMVSYDMFRNVSLLSNVAQASTLQPERLPVIAVNPIPLEIKMLPTDSIVKKIYITNFGNADLKYAIGVSERLEVENKILTFSRRSGTVAPGTSDTLLLTFKTFEFTQSIYENIIITNDDPNNSAFSWPVMVSFIETSGKPLFSTTKVNIGKTMVGTNSEQTVTLKSTGSKLVKLVKYSIDNPAFTAHISDFFIHGAYNSFFLYNYDTMLFKVFFHPSTTGITTGTLTFVTDDPENPILTLPLSGEGTPAPSVRIASDTLSASLKSNASTTRRVTLSNPGEQELTFSILEKGPVVEQKKVLVISPDPSATWMSVFLTGLREISIDMAPENLGNLVLADLTQYDALIVLNNWGWKQYADIEPERLGDLLADYIDAGGKVIVNQSAYAGFGYAASGLAGRFITEGYGPFIADVSPGGSIQTLGEVEIPHHPLLEDVRTLTYRGAIDLVKLAPGATGIAKWSGGQWLLAATGNVVAMNFIKFNKEYTTGDVLPLYRNAIRWLTGSSNLTVQPAKGTLAPGQSVDLDVQINSNKLATGLYHAALGIVTNVPNQGQIIIPIGIQVEGPVFSLTPGAVSLTAGVGEQSTQDVTLRNEGLEAFPYVINIQNIKPVHRVVADSTTSQYYSTDFGGFDLGRFSHPEMGWLDSGRWYIDTLDAYSGRQHLRYTTKYSAVGALDPVELISPAIEGDAVKSFCSATIKIVGQGASFGVSAVSFPTEVPVTTVTFVGDGTVRATIYNEQLKSFDVVPINEPIPSGYFTVSFEVDRTTSVFKVYFDHKLVLTGTGPLGTINAIGFDSDNKNIDNSLYVGNVIVRHGVEETVPEFLQVSPWSGVLQPGGEVVLAAEADAKGLKMGEYSADVVANIGDGTTYRSVPVSFVVTGGASAMDVSRDAIDAVVDYQSTAARFFEISNFGGEPFEFTIDIPEEAQSWLSVEPASGIVGVEGIAVVKVKYTSAALTPGETYASTISVNSNAAKKPSKVITTSAVVGEPARLIVGPPFLSVDIVGGNAMDFPLTLTNGGNSVLQLKFEETNQDWLSVETDTKYLQPRGGQYFMAVRLSAVDLSAGVYQDTLHIQSNDPENLLFLVPVQITVIAPPAWSVSSDSIKISTVKGKQISKTITLANTGDKELLYSIGNQVIDGVTPFHGGPDAFGYTFIETRQLGGPAFVWNDIATTGVQVRLGECDSLTVALPFGFSFYGREQHEVKISSDGFLAFKTVGFPTRTLSDRNFFSTAGPQAIIAAHWDDLDPASGGTIHYKAEADKFIVQYTNINKNTSGHGTPPGLQNTFQMVLHSDGSIAFHYLDIMNFADQGVGIENLDATDALVVKENSDFQSEDATSILFMPTVPWMFVTYQSGSVTGGANNEVEIQFNAPDVEGTYKAMLYITSNDRKNAVTRIPVTMEVQADITTATEKGETEEVLNLYPVPTKDQLNIQWTRKVTRPVTLVIRNAQGQTILLQQVSEDRISNYSLYLNSLHMATGIYSLQLIDHKGVTISRSFVKE